MADFGEVQYERLVTRFHPTCYFIVGFEVFTGTQRTTRRHMPEDDNLHVTSLFPTTSNINMIVM
jgi:hypothetical protein